MKAGTNLLGSPDDAVSEKPAMPKQWRAVDFNDIEPVGFLL